VPVIRVGEVPSSNLGAPIPYRTANTSEHGRKPAKLLSLAGRCSRLFLAVRGDWDRKRTAEWALRSLAVHLVRGDIGLSVDTPGCCQLSGAGRVAGLTQVEWQSDRPRPGRSLCRKRIVPRDDH
jgi:hypothetical protein